MLLAEQIPGIPHPYNFGLLYLVAFPCLAACSWLAARLHLPEAKELPSQSFSAFIRGGVRAFWIDPRLRFTWFAYLLWYCALGGMNNLSLYTREVMGRSPIELAGLIMALRFGIKSLAGFGFGAVAQHYGARAAMILTLVFVGIGISWPFVSTGYVYLFAFGLMGAGELGGVYFSNYIISVSRPEDTTRNVALLSLVGPVSSVAPALHGGLADQFGFHASFSFGLLVVVVAFVLLQRTRPVPQAAIP
jgi:hypothetical protein